jgi:hypothetical protein
LFLALGVNLRLEAPALGGLEDASGLAAGEIPFVTVDVAKFRQAVSGDPRDHLRRQDVQIARAGKVGRKRVGAEKRADDLDRLESGKGAVDLEHADLIEGG